jgi:hypothetical protein
MDAATGKRRYYNEKTQRVWRTTPNGQTRTTNRLNLLPFMCNSPQMILVMPQIRYTVLVAAKEILKLESELRNIEVHPTKKLVS